MVLYRRNRVTGGTYFFTVTLRDRNTRVLVEYINELRAAIRAVKRVRPFRIDAMVVLPEHLHAVWTLPWADDDYAGRWRSIKGCYTRALAKAGMMLLRNARANTTCGSGDIGNIRCGMKPTRRDMWTISITIP